MPSVDTYSASSMSFGFPWPEEVTGLERIILSAQGDLQRYLSSFFARPITVSRIFTITSVQESPNTKLIPLSLPNPTAVASTSPITPIVQQRKVHLVCAGKVVCTATSTVRMGSPECAHFVLEEKYAVGQVFRRLGKPPVFELVAVGMGHNDAETEEKTQGGTTITDEPAGANQLWRKYRLAIPEFECEILEVFPSREMFTRCEQWLMEKPSNGTSSLGRLASFRSPAKMKNAVSLIYIILFFFVAILEIRRFTS